jgi:hypothetical protein
MVGHHASPVTQPENAMKRGLIVLMLCTPFAGARAQDAKAEVMQVVRTLFDGMRKVDSAMVRPLFHPKARMITAMVRNGAPVVRVEESVDAFVQSVGRPRNEVWDERISNEKVEVDGPLASVWVDYSFFRGDTFSHCGVDHFLLVKDGGAWKILELADTRRTEGCRTG